MNEPINALLVHGAAHDSSCWDTLIPELERSHGITAHSLTLSGHGNNYKNHFRISMKTYADDVCDMAQFIGGTVVLVGHSLGGAVISMAAEMRPELFDQLIYVSAIVPNVAANSVAASLKQTPELTNPDFDKLGKTALSRGSLYYPPNKAIRFFYNECVPQVQSQAASRLCRQPIRPFFSKMKLTEEKLGSVRKDYIECTLDNCLPIGLQRHMQTNMGFTSVLTLPSDHSPFLSMPVELGGAIASLVIPEK